MIARYPARMAGGFLFVALFLPVHGRAENAGQAKPRTIGTHAGGIATTHFSPDGKYLASAGGDRTIRVWDVAAAKQRFEWKGPSSFACSVRFSPDGKVLAAGGYETGPGNAIYLYDVATGKELPRLTGHPTGGVRRILFTHDGKQLLSGGFDGTVRIWDLATSKEIRCLKVEAGTVYSLALSPDGRTIATAGRDGLKLWELATGKELPREPMSRHACVAVAYSPDGKLLACGDSSCVKLWEAATGKEVATLKGYKGEISYLLFSRDGRTLYTASYDRAIRLWEVRTGQLVHEAEAHTGWVWGIALSPDEKHLASCSVDTRLLCWDLRGLGRPTAKRARLTEGQLETHWTDLASTDAGTAYRAICALASDPKRSLPLLQQRLNTVQPRGPDRTAIERMIRDLDADEYAIREKASADLEKSGAQVVPALKKTLTRPPSLEVRRRIERLLVRLDPSDLPPEELTAVRSVQTLEYMNTPEARLLLEELSRSRSGRLMEEASRAVERLGNASVSR